jgi:hypothetical protein
MLSCHLITSYASYDAKIIQWFFLDRSFYLLLIKKKKKIKKKGAKLREKKDTRRVCF